MTISSSIHPTQTNCCILLVLSLAAAPSFAQHNRPAPQPPQLVVSLDVPEISAEPEARPAAPDLSSPLRTGPNRRPTETGKVAFAFDDVNIEETIPFVMDTTGKVVMPVRLSTLKNTKITLVNNELLERSAALDLLFEAFRLHGVGVIENDEVIILDSLEEMSKSGALPVLDADVDIMNRADRASLVIKIFRIKKADAETVGDQINETLPTHATLSVDANSNQIVVVGDIGLCQQMQQMIDELDDSYVTPETRTFRLRWADANEIAQNILDLFEETGTTTAGTRAAPRARRPTQRGRTAQPQPGTTAVTTGVRPMVELRVTVNVQTNSVTVQSAADVMEQVTDLIYNYWDLPRPRGTAKVYLLKYTDPLKIRDLLNNMLGGGGGRAGVGGATRRAGGAAGAAGAAGRAGVEQIVGGIYTIEAYPDSNSLIVICKTEESFDFLDNLIDQLDQPSDIGMPLLIPLRHADAVRVTEVLNVLLAEPGSGAGGITVPETGLTGGGTDRGAQAATGTTATAGGLGSGRAGSGPAGVLNFPWQGGRIREDQSPESSLIGKVRIVPVVRQNAIAVLAPPAHREAIRELITQHDQPARQVMISAILAEVALTDAFSLGLRLSSEDIVSTGRPDNAFRGSGSIVGSSDNIFPNLFDTSILDANFDFNVFFQALDQKNRVRILQEPRIFTADNEEANFFDGQDVPFISDSQTTDVGGLTESFEYREVGVSLNVRPHITTQGDVDMEVNLELSNIVPGEILFGGFIFDRRETTTKVSVKNGQTIVLSGILRDEESEIKRKVPFLGDIPLLGELFTSRDKETTRTELLAFITPTVVNELSENDTNFNEAERQRLEELSRPLKDQTTDELLDHGRIRSRIVPVPPKPSTMELWQAEEQLNDA
ncbi:MAG: type II secretion system protein GspD [Planctomycetota bacterium]